MRHLDYRDVAETDFDAVSSIGLTEHIGKAQLPDYFAFLYGKLKPLGRLLNHCITRPDNTGPTHVSDGFIYRYVFPDGELEGPGHLMSLMHDAGFEVRHEENLREHYAKTLDGLVREPGRTLGRGRRGGRRGNGSGVAAVHGRARGSGSSGTRSSCTRSSASSSAADGESGMPLRPDWEPPAPKAASAREVGAGR